MLAVCRRIVILGVGLAAIGPLAAAGDGYRLILRDGSYISALEKPVVEGGIAKVRLGGGLFAAVPEARIDWRRSDAASAGTTFGVPLAVPRAAPAAPRPAGAGVFTLIGEPVTAPAAGAVAAPARGAASESPAAPDPRAEIRARVTALNEELDGLQRTKLDLEDRIRKTIQLEEIPGLRLQVDQIDADIKTKRAAISALILQESDAARP